MPTLTWRNRAGGAPCETCALCPGCPFPQFVRPPMVHSLCRRARPAAPELGCDAHVGRLRTESAALALLDLPADLGSELEVEALVVDRPVLLVPRRIPSSTSARRSSRCPRRAPGGGSSSEPAASGSSHRPASTRRRPLRGATRSRGSPGSPEDACVHDRLAGAGTPSSS